MYKTLIPSLLVIVLSLSLNSASAQERINSGDLLEKGTALHDEGKFKEAIALYKKISRSDTNYYRALHELAYTSYSDSNFAASKAYAEEGLLRFPEKKDEWYNLMANATDDMGNRAEALKYYDEIIKLNPNSYISWFNKGVTLMNDKKYAEAKENLQKALLINPYYTSAHYFLGTISFEEGRMVPAMLSFTSALIINPENRYVSSIVKYLSAIAKATDEVTKNTAKRKASSIDDFEIQEEILSSKVALDPQYKLQTTLEDPITKQLQVLLEKLEYNAADKGFWMQYYVPYYKDILSSGNYNLLANYMFTGLQIKEVQSFTKKNKKELETFMASVSTYFNEIKETQTVNYAARATSKIHYYWNEKSIAGKGDWRVENNEKKLFGPWEFYYSNGQLKSKGVLNDKEEKEGPWEFYYDNGILKEKSVYKADKVEGYSESWYDNGLLYSQENYKYGELHGESKEYYYSGILKQVSQYAGGKKNGTEKGYSSRGLLNSIYRYKDGLQDGEQVNYFINGKVYYTSVYTNGKANGAYKKYENDGSLIMEGNFVNDEADGLWKEYHAGKKLKKEYTYVDGKLQGIYKEYYSNGQLSETTLYDKGSLHGKNETFDKAGKIYTESIYEKGRLKEIKFYDRSGKITGTGKGGDNIIFYDAYGNKTAEAFFTKEGLRIGKAAAYYPDGKIKITSFYKDGKLNGEHTIYYRNGVVSEKVNYTDDEEDGYYTSFYENGKPKYKGWMVAGLKEQEHTEYNVLGEVTTVSFYRNDELHGYSVTYNANGTRDYEQYYEYGWLKHTKQFDSTGKVIAEVDLPKGETAFTFKHFNGKDYTKGSYANYNLTGRYDFFFYDGTVNAKQFYKAGYRDSISTSLFYGGKTLSQGNYILGEKDGEWKYYFKNGKLQKTENYVYGDLQGKCVMYNDDGSLDKEMTYKNNMLDSAYKIYGPSNQLAVTLNYSEDELVSYTYADKDGKPVQPVTVINETAMVTAYYKNGNKSVEMNFENGQVNGVRKIYSSNGKLYVDATRSFGDDDGIKKIYDENGQLMSEENYVLGNLDGINKYYYANGKLKAEENWHAGELTGLSKYYDETGKLKEARLYYYNLLLEVKRF